MVAGRSGSRPPLRISPTNPDETGESLSHPTPAASRTSRRGRIIWALSIAVAVLLGVAGVVSGDLSSVGASLASADRDLVVLAAVLYAVGQCMSGLMWGACQRAGGVDGIGWGQVLSLHWISRAACETLPASLGEAVRVALVRRHRAGREAGTWRIAGGLAAYKALDGVVTGVVVLGILLAAPLPSQIAALRITAVVAVAVGMGVLVLAFTASGRGAGRGRVGRMLAGVRDGAAVLRRPGEVRGAGLLGVGAIVARIASLAALLAAFQAPAGAALMVFAVIVLAGLLPLAPGGAGAREALLVPALAAGGAVPAHTALAFSVSIQGVSLLVTLAAAAVAAVLGRRQTDMLPDVLVPEPEAARP